MDKGHKLKNLKAIRRQNVLESLKDIGSGTVGSLKRDLLEGGSKDLLDQIFGNRTNKKYSGEISVGESLKIDELISGEHQEKQKLEGQLSLERQLRQEETILVEQKGQQLKLQLHAITQEVVALAQSTQDLGEEVELAAMTAPSNPGVYHVVFFEKLLGFIKSFRKRIESAGIWLHATNKRAEKKNFWGLYKKHGSKFLLSPDHYLQRSAG
jgi:hypothetical protein